MLDTKKFWQAKGIVGPAVSMVAFIAGIAGLPDAVTSAEAQADVVRAINDAITLCGLLVGIYGRWTASKAIG